MKNIAAAILKIQAEIRGATKNKSNDHFKSKYADLESVWNALREKLQKNEIAVVQVPAFRDGVSLLKTIAIHTPSGETIEGEYIIRTKDDPQAHASGFTYARRFSLCGLFGLSNEDDDGTKAAAKKNANADISKIKGTGTLNATQKLTLQKACKENGWTPAMVAAYLAEKFEYATTAEIKTEQYPEVLTVFSNKPQAVAN